MGAPPDAWTILNQIPTAEIQEQVRWGEVLTELIGIEVDFANKYMVKDPHGQDIILFAEQTDFCTRQMKRGCCADCVGWNVDAITTYGGQRTPFLKMERPFTFTFCCFNRPVVHISEFQTGRPIGSFRDPFACCDLTFTVMGPDGTEVLESKGGCCQWGLCCPLPCGPCAEVNFDIWDKNTQQEVGHIKKTVPSCCKFLIDSEVDNYKVDFNGVQNPEWKAMLLALSVFIDFRYFSETQDPNEVGETGLLGMAMNDGGDAGGFDAGGGGGFDFGGDE